MLTALALWSAGLGVLLAVAWWRLRERPCPACAGTGRWRELTCLRCGGAGRIE